MLTGERYASCHIVLWQSPHAFGRAARSAPLHRSLP